MPLAFFAPLFIAGSALLAVPWIIHQIRRPERELLKFSSLMFIPKMDHQVIERRRIQHILLMLLRMLLVLLLVLAFSRPYWRAPLAAGDGEGQTARRLILLDNSFSMGALDWFAQAKDEARSIVASAGPDDRIGVMTFAAGPRMLAALSAPDDPEVGSASLALLAIGRAELTEESTDYLGALQAAQQALLPGAEADLPEELTLILHLITDFQLAGMPAEASWKLPPQITLETVEVGFPDAPNQSIVDLGVRKTSAETLRIQGKVKNWSSGDDRSVNVALYLDGEKKDESQITVKARNSSQVSFSLPLEGRGAVQGWLQLGPDALDIDNRRYFAWNPPRRRRILMVADTDPSRRWPASMFIESALTASESLPWEFSSASGAELGSELAPGTAQPELVLAADWRSMTADTASRLLEYVSGGGQVLLALNDAISPERLNSAMLGPLGLSTDGLRFPRASPVRFEMLSWVDLTHPIFSKFQGARFNDFSQIRFFNYHRLRIAQPGAPADSDLRPRILAEFEGDPDGDPMPAIVEIPHGKGRVLIWAFSPELQWTNLPKHIKYIPMLHETVTYLTGGDTMRRSWDVGEDYRGLPRTSGAADLWVVQMPGGELVEPGAQASPGADPLLLRHSGFVSWREKTEADWQQVDAANIQIQEADPARISLQEFELKLTAAPILEDPSDSADPEQKLVPAGFVVKRQYWRPLLAFLFFFLLVECWYAPRLLR